MNTITLSQIENIPLDEALQLENHVIEHYIVTTPHIIHGDIITHIWDVYHIEQAEDSDPDPIYTSSNPIKIVNFLNK